MTGTIDRVGVVGCGIMGTGIAHVCARAGVDVLVAVSSTNSLKASRERVHTSLDRELRKGSLTADEHDRARHRISFTAQLDDLADRHLVIESVRENEPDKRALLTVLDQVLAPGAILASNTSTIPISRLAAVTTRPGRMIGLHFFNPVPVLPLVELVVPLGADEPVAARADNFVTGVLGKKLIRSSDRAGFVVNSLLLPFLLDSVRMVESGFATAQAVDDGMVLGCSHPIGPLRLIDLIGVDTVVAMSDALFAEFKDVRYAPPPTLLRMAEADQLGRKTGKGFYSYS